MQYFNLREHHRWIDYKTRVVFLDVDIYNATTRLFSHVKLFFELPTLGSINMVKQVWSANRYPYVHALAYFILLLQLIFIVIWCVRLVFFLYICFGYDQSLFGLFALIWDYSRWSLVLLPSSTVFWESMRPLPR